MIEDKQLMADLLKLPAAERLELAQILIESAANPAERNGEGGATLVSLAGRYAGDPRNTAQNDESILETEIDPLSGLSVR